MVDRSGREIEEDLRDAQGEVRFVGLYIIKEASMLTTMKSILLLLLLLFIFHFFGHCLLLLSFYIFGRYGKCKVTGYFKGLFEFVILKREMLRVFFFFF